MSSMWQRFVDRVVNPNDPPPRQSAVFATLRDTFATTLPSVLDGAYFHATFAVSWRQNPELPDGGQGLVQGTLQSWAARRAAKESPSQAENLQHALNHQLQSPMVMERDVQILTASVRVAITSSARQAAADWDELQRRLALDRLRQRTELAELAYLRDHIFAQPEVARSYWLKRHPDAVMDVLDDRFERIAEKMGTASREEDAQMSVARLLTEFVGNMTVAERQYLLSQLGQVFVSFGRTDLADRLPAEHMLPSTTARQ